MAKPEYVTIRLTRKQAESAEAALGNLMRNADEFMDIQRYVWEDESLWRLRARLVSALEAARCARCGKEAVMVDDHGREVCGE